MDLNILWLVLCAALLALLLRRLFKKAPAAPTVEGERSPVLVEGSTAYTGMHKGVKYWVYFDNNQSRMEIEIGADVSAPYVADRRAGPAKMPGDPRDAEVMELFKLRALYVEVADTGNLIGVQFPERVLNANAGSTYAPAPDEAMANQVCELLAAIREKSRKPAAEAEREKKERAE